VCGIKQKIKQKQQQQQQQQQNIERKNNNTCLAKPSVQTINCNTQFTNWVILLQQNNPDHQQFTLKHFLFCNGYCSVVSKCSSS
jgi:hypothetical protein